MAILTLTLPLPINTSLQAKTETSNISSSDGNGAWDIINFTRIENNKQFGDIYRLGKCIGIVSGSSTYNISVEADETAQTPDDGDYVFFGKENKVNISGVRGYYAEVEMRNDSSSKGELISVGSEMSTSSK